MGMAATNYEWITDLGSAVVSNVSDLIAPLEEMWSVHRIPEGAGINAINVPASTGVFSASSVTPGTIDTSNDSDYDFLGTTITPTPYAIKVPVARRHLALAQPAQIADLINRMTEAAHQQLMNLIGTAVGAASITATGSSGNALTAALFKSAKWTLNGQKAGGQKYAMLTAAAMDDLETSLESNATYGSLGEDIVNGVNFFRYSGCLVYPDVYLGNDGTDGYSIMGTKDSLHIVVGMDPTVSILPTDDPVNVRLAMEFWYAVGIPNVKKLTWIKSSKS